MLISGADLGANAHMTDDIGKLVHSEPYMEFNFS